MKKKKILSLGIITYIVLLSLGCGSGGGGNNHTPDTEQTNAKPLAVIKGNINAKPGQLIELSGSDSSDPDGDLLTHKWSLMFSPTGAKATLSSINTPDTSITPDIDGLYRIQLIVNDGTVDSNPSTIEIIASTPNSAPIANAGSGQIVTVGSLVTLNGSNSTDHDGDNLSYKWSFVSIPVGSSATLFGANAVSPAFIADVEGAYEITLIVNDGVMNSTSDTVIIIAIRILTLPDTGQTNCYDSSMEIICPNLDEQFYGQDAQYLINQMSFTDNGNGGLTDNVTGLMWQMEDDNVKRTWDDAVAYCESKKLGGFDDWRLPTKSELINIIDYENYDPAIDINAFPNTDIAYWSSTSFFVNDYAWYVNFRDGTDFYSIKYEDNRYVRCVRGGPTESYLFDNADGTVTDYTSGLMWQQEQEEMTMTWRAALSYCEKLTLARHSDWQLPNIKELASIVYHPQIFTNINDIYFPNTPASSFWTSTTIFIANENAWGIDFDDGNITQLAKTKNNYVRCVR